MPAPPFFDVGKCDASMTPNPNARCQERTRFAPSPTGVLHLGHVFSALVAARNGGGRFVLRIDDIDHTRCRPEFTKQIVEDLGWLGFEWHDPIVFESDRMEAYGAALNRLKAMDLLYPCYLSRTEINALLSAPQESSAIIETDRQLPRAEQQRRRDSGLAPAWRLRTAAALKKTGPLFWRDAGSGRDIAVNMGAFGDVVIARKDIGASYHLCVVIDDSLDRVSLVTRGTDLASSTHVHRLLQALLDIESPVYLHHDLVTNADGIRLAKRDNATSIAQLRTNGHSAESVLAMLPEPPRFWNDKRQ